MSPLPDSDWQVQIKGQEYGPYSRTRILSMLAKGELPETAAIRQAGMADWLPVPAARGLLQAHQAGGAAVAAPPLASSVAADPAPAAASAKPARSKALWVYAAIALLALAAVGWSFGSGDPAGEAGYAKVKEELVHRMEVWRDQGLRLESVPASAVDGPLVRYAIDPPQAPIGDGATSHTFVVHCTFRDARGVESESKVTVTIESKRLRLWNLFSK